MCSDWNVCALHNVFVHTCAPAEGYTNLYVAVANETTLQIKRSLYMLGMFEPLSIRVQ